MENGSGTLAYTFLVKVLDTPAEVEDMTVTSVKKNYVTVSWKPSDNDGGSAILGYVLEQKESTKKAWTVVENSWQRTSYKFSKLAEGSCYLFR